MHCKKNARTPRAAAGSLAGPGAAGGQAAAPLPRVALLATGWTIASRGADKLALTDYGPDSGLPPVGIEALVAAVPEVGRFARVTGEQLFNVGSSRLGIDHWLALAGRAGELLASDGVDGLVITHGTDTLEETAYFLHLVLRSAKPVVLVGAMRPATGLSADGPLNLVNAVALAASPAARGKGVLVAMNDIVAGAFGVAKTHATNAAAFASLDGADLGHMQDAVPHFVAQPLKRHTVRSEFDVSGLRSLPRVDVNFTTLGSDGLLVDAAVAAGARGIVNAGVGHGNMPEATMRSLRAAQRKGVAVVVASRVPGGMVTPVAQSVQAGFVSSMMHTAQKARILLMLGLTRTDDPAELQRMFDEY